MDSGVTQLIRTNTFSYKSLKSCKVIDNSKVVQPTKSMESGQQTFYFTGMFLLKLAGHVTKLSINSNWLLVFILLSVIIFIGWRVYSCFVHRLGCILFQANVKGKLSATHNHERQWNCQLLYMPPTAFKKTRNGQFWLFQLI